MTTSQTFKPVLSANDFFKSQYNKVLRWSLLAALVLTALSTWLFPEYNPKPYVLRDNFLEIQKIEIIEEIELLTKPQIKPPVIVREIEPVEGELEDDFILPDNFGWDTFPQITSPSQQDYTDKFIPTSNNPVLVYFAKPDYPEIARRSRLEGLVIIKVLVGKDGLVEKTMIIQGVNPILDKAAAQAARKCRFKAGTQRTIPVRAWMAIPYSFKLN